LNIAALNTIYSRLIIADKYKTLYSDVGQSPAVWQRILCQGDGHNDELFHSQVLKLLDSYKVDR
jgi:hypothetical protein